MKYATALLAAIIATASALPGGAWSKDWRQPSYGDWHKSTLKHSWSGSDWDQWKSEHKQARQFNVVVGGPGKLSYDPPTLAGLRKHDVIVFSFLERNHTVTESSFNTPCTKIDDAFDTDFVPNLDGKTIPTPVRALVMEDDDSHYFYCKQRMGNHCGKGMVFAVNLPYGRSFEQFKQNAINQNGGLPDMPAPAPAPAPGTPAPAPVSVGIPPEISASFKADTRLQIDFPATPAIREADGADLSTVDTSKVPQFFLSGESAITPSRKFTIAMVDLDAATPKLMYLRANMQTGNSIDPFKSEGAPTIPYTGPETVKDSNGKPTHRFLFLLYSQPADFKGFDYGQINTGNFDAVEFGKKNGLGAPVSGTHIVAKVPKA